ncbi:MAG TPA: SMP-30/gluconolactonase/LRE family protein [Pseudonocardia sp.]|nr:SMP-30/gluconolactonase/LRE family protein [Pseudonocardia sp.]
MREICDGLRFPEGPIAMPDGSVLLVEIARGTLTRVAPDGRVEVVAETGGGPNGAALGPDDTVYICNNGGFSWREASLGPGPDGAPQPLLLPVHQAEDYTGGSIQTVRVRDGAAVGPVATLYTHCGDRPLRGPNDLVFDRHGGFYFTDLGKGRVDDMDRGALYYGLADGSGVREVAYPLLTPNGVGLSPAGDRVYWAETATGRVWYLDLEGPGVPRSTGPQISSTSAAATMLANVGGAARLDSLAVDSEGNVCVATLMVGAITAIAPDGGIRAIVPVPGGDPMITNVCFGGPDLSTAYITASGTGRLLAHEWHCPGLPLEHLNR